jgi:hypothetical protein
MSAGTSVNAGSKRTCARSTAKFTCAVAPGRRFSTFSMRAAQATQVMPSIARSMFHSTGRRP